MPTFQLGLDRCLGFGIGGQLSQEVEGIWRPVVFYSRRMTPTEQKYGIHGKELLGVIKAAKKWNFELWSVKNFTIGTDHKNL